MSENKTTQTHRRPVIVASTVLAGGIIVSLWFNLKAISLEANAEAGAYISGILWPLALLVSIELLIHTPWRKGWADTLTKGGVLVLVAGVAAWISYWHGVHVLDHWGYDEVGMRVGPVVPDAAMALATLALQRFGQARRAAATALATGHVAIPAPATAPVATPAPVAIPAPATQEMDLATDWATLEEDLDRDLAEMIQAGQTATADAPSNAPASPAPTSETPAVALTTVPQAAADAIRTALAADPKAAATTVAADLVAAGLATSDRSGRRYVAAIKNNTARVS